MGGPELWPASGLSQAGSCPERGAVVWSQPAINAPAQIATSPFDIELRSMLDFNNMMPPGLAAA